MFYETAEVVVPHSPQSKKGFHTSCQVIHFLTEPMLIQRRRIHRMVTSPEHSYRDHSNIIGISVGNPYSMPRGATSQRLMQTRTYQTNMVGPLDPIHRIIIIFLASSRHHQATENEAKACYEPNLTKGLLERVR